MKATAVIAGGGSGNRFGSSTPKQFTMIAGAPLLIHTLRAFEKASAIEQVVVVLPQADLSFMEKSQLERYEISKVCSVVSGGQTRQASVTKGLEAILWRTDYVAIHDAARCMVTPDLIDRTVSACVNWDGVVLALPVRDTLKRVDGQKIIRTESRENLWGMQTPQVFRFPFILDAYRTANAKGLDATDDAAVAEAAGGMVRVVEGLTRNFKVTYREDLNLVERILR